MPININPWRAWYYVVQSADMPGNKPSIGDLMANYFTGALVQPPIDDPFAIELLQEQFAQGGAPGLWVPDRLGETPEQYVGRVEEGIRAISAAKLGPWLVVLNPEHNGMGYGPRGQRPAEPGWQWLGKMLGIYRLGFASRLTDVSFPAMQDGVNYPAIFGHGCRLRLQLYGGDSGEVRFDPLAAFERVRINSFLDPGDVDARRVSFDVGARHADYYLAPVNAPGLPAGLPRLLAAGLRGIALWEIDSDWDVGQRSYHAYRSLIEKGYVALR